LVKTVYTTVSDGELNIMFLHGVENPTVSAIEVISWDGSADSEAPSVPVGVLGNEVSGGRVDLTWDASTDTGGSGLAGYKVYRDGVEIGVTSSGSYSDAGLLPETEYWYTVAAYDYAGNVSSVSEPVIVVTASAGALVIRINAGGGEYTDGMGNVWLADYGYATGRLALFSGPVSGTADDYLFQSSRWDELAAPELEYRISVPDGGYVVNLSFADGFSGTAGIGKRVFDVFVEGVLAIDDLDIYGEVGSSAALVKTVYTTVSDGELNIMFLHGVENPTINAIEVVRQP